MFGHQPHPQRVELYTGKNMSQRLFVTNLTNSARRFEIKPKLTVLLWHPYTTRSSQTVLAR